MKDVLITMGVLVVGAVLFAFPPLGIAVGLIFGFMLLQSYLKEGRQQREEHERFLAEQERERERRLRGE